MTRHPLNGEPEGGRPGSVDREPLTIVYVLGIPRSGTTIVARLLSTQPGWVFAGEVRRTWRVGLGSDHCGCGETFERCPIWSNLLEPGRRFRGMDAREIAQLQDASVPNEHALRRALRILARGLTDRRYVDVLRAFYRRFALAAEARVIVDSSKMPADALLLGEMDGVRAVMLHVVRDPRATVHSQLSRRPSRADDLPMPWIAGRRSLGWIGRNAVSELVARTFDPRSLRIRYEDAVADPDRMVADVAGTTGGQASPVPRDVLGRVLLPAGHGASAVAGAWAAGGVEVADERRWTSELRGLDRAVVEAVCLPAIVRYGYRIGARPGRGL